MTISLIQIVWFFLGAVTAPTNRRCDFVIDSASPVLADSIQARRLIADAAAIVRAKAVAVDRDTSNGRASDEPAIRFDVLETLKSADAIPQHLIVAPARFTAGDDFNPLAVPYTTARPSGLRGNCFATEYRLGAEYLLFLGRGDDGRLTPYWEPLAPTNEELRGPVDAWLLWVRAHLPAPPSRRASHPSIFRLSHGSHPPPTTHAEHSGESRTE